MTLMIMAIYLAVGLAIFGFFKRDALMVMFAPGADEVVSEVSVAAVIAEIMSSR